MRQDEAEPLGLSCSVPGNSPPGQLVVQDVVTGSPRQAGPGKSGLGQQRDRGGCNPQPCLPPFSSSLNWGSAGAGSSQESWDPLGKSYAPLQPFGVGEKSSAATWARRLPPQLTERHWGPEAPSLAGSMVEKRTAVATRTRGPRSGPRCLGWRVGISAG